MGMQLLELPAHLRGGLVGMDRGRCSAVTKPYLVKELKGRCLVVMKLLISGMYRLTYRTMSNSTQVQSVFASAREERKWNRVSIINSIAYYVPTESILAVK